MKQKRNVYYSSVQIRKEFKKHVVNYCDQFGIKISSFVENACRAYISGSLSGSVPDGK